MTTENVAILFTDIVGSTELSQRLSAEAADDVRRAHFAALRQAVAETGGTEVKNLGDGLMVVFCLGLGGPRLRGGHATGRRPGQPARRPRRRPAGRAQRGGGQPARTTTTSGTRWWRRPGCAPGARAGRSWPPRWSGPSPAGATVTSAGRVGELELKGLDEPVETVEVLWEPLGRLDRRRRRAAPGRLAVRARRGRCGPDGEAGGHRRRRSSASSTGGGREVLLVSGEAGLGKTTLVAESARPALHAGGACVLFGHCEEELATPYQLFAEALGHYVTHAPEDQLLAHVDAHGSELARLVPALASRIPDLPPTRATDSDTERFLLFAAVVGLLAAIARDQPVVLVLDDLQWADKGSLLLLRHLAAADRPCGCWSSAPTGTASCPIATRSLDTLAALRRQDGVSRIELGGPGRHRGGRAHGGRGRPRPSATRPWAWPTPSTARPTATRSS